MRPTHRETFLKHMAHQRLEAGELPNDRLARTWAGPGEGQACSVCDEPIEVEQVEYEVDVPDGEAFRTYRFHLVCHQIWLFEIGSRSNIVARGRGAGRAVRGDCS